MNRDQAMSRIRKCLALAKSSNSHEAAAALRQAQKLMAAFNLDHDDIELDTVQEAEAKARFAALVNWETRLSNMVAEAFGCKVISETRFVGFKRQRVWLFIGVGPAAEVCSYAFAVLARQCACQREAYIKKQSKNCKQATKTARGDAFANGWVNGVAALVQRFADSRGHEQLVERYIAANYSSLQKVDAVNRIGKSAYEHMYEGELEGRKARLDRPLGQTNVGLLR
jgi:hypothetical protein